MLWGQIIALLVLKLLVMVKMKDSLDYIYTEQKQLSVISGIGALLGWDQMTYMPSHGSQERSDQLSLISRLAHEKFTSDELYHHVKQLNEQHMFQELNFSVCKSLFF